MKRDPISGSLEELHATQRQLNRRKEDTRVARLVEALTTAERALHAILATAYRVELDFRRLVCRTCNTASYVNPDGKTFKIEHDFDCLMSQAIKAERKSHDLLAEIGSAQGKSE